MSSTGGWRVFLAGEPRDEQDEQHAKLRVLRHDAAMTRVLVTRGMTVEGESHDMPCSVCLWLRLGIA